MPNRSLRYWPLLLLLTVCVRTPQPSGQPNKYVDVTMRLIGTAQDERNVPALLPWLSNGNPIYRREAALALASVQSRAAVPSLLPMLRDVEPGVRRAAAYALGQTGDSTAVDSLRVRVLEEKDDVVRRYVHEALGRTVTRHSLPELWRVEVLTDTARAAALAWGLGRAALRGLSSPESIRRTVLLLNDPTLPVRGRLAAVVGLSRTRGLDADLARLATNTLLTIVQKDHNYAVRSASALALGKIAALADKPPVPVPVVSDPAAENSAAAPAPPATALAAP
ncbi:MAG: HEAT repeat domain-containing protein, partial [Bacteroidota bacterium]|nr:HEAT repeat domain-containing protein [Bacteroidota bacterium]